MKTCVYVNGLITNPEAAVVPALDRGFLYGDSVYEVFWWHRGVLIQEREHMERLADSARRIYMELQPTHAKLVQAIEETMRAAGAGPDTDAYVRLVVTRGVGALGLAFDAEVTQSVIVVVAPANRPSPAQVERGLSAAFVERRRTSKLALDPGAKTGNYMNNLLALKEAKLAGADDGLMLNAKGEVTEATTANLYLLREGVVTTPPVEAGILMGTTRARILALCASAEIPASESRVTPADVLAADEVFLSSSVRGILPITAIDGQPVGTGALGPVTRRIRELFEAAAAEEAARAADPDRPAAS